MYRLYHLKGISRAALLGALAAGSACFLYRHDLYRHALAMAFFNFCRRQLGKDQSTPVTISGGKLQRIPVGLVNQGATCYLNSMMQALYMTPEFRNAIYRMKFDYYIDLDRIFKRNTRCMKQDTTSPGTTVVRDAMQDCSKLEVSTVKSDSIDISPEKEKNNVGTRRKSDETDPMPLKATDVEETEHKIRKNQDNGLISRSIVNTSHAVVTTSETTHLVMANTQDDGGHAVMNNTIEDADGEQTCSRNDGTVGTEMQRQSKCIDAPEVHTYRLPKNDDKAAHKTPDAEHTLYDAIPTAVEETISAEKEQAIKPVCNDHEDVDGSRGQENTNTTGMKQEAVLCNGAMEVTEDQNSYELFAILVHGGSTEKGHYSSLIKNRDDWYRFADKHVTKVGEEAIQATYGGAAGKGNAYMLMYRNCKLKEDFMPEEGIPQHLIDQHRKSDGEQFTSMMSSVKSALGSRFDSIRKRFLGDQQPKDESSCATVDEADACGGREQTAVHKVAHV